MECKAKINNLVFGPAASQEPAPGILAPAKRQAPEKRRHLFKLKMHTTTVCGQGFIQTPLTSLEHSRPLAALERRVALQ